MEQQIQAETRVEVSAPTRLPAWRRRRRDRILSAAADQFAANPYPAVSMDDVARAATMGKATLYRYFPSKEDLYIAVFDSVLDTLAAELDAAVSAGGGPGVVLRRLIATLVPALGGHFRALRAIDAGVVQVAERKRELFRRRRQSIAGRIERIIADGIESGEFRPVRASACAQMILGMVWSGSVAMTDSTETIAQTVSDLFLNGALAAARR